ncbi:choice-of-anchor L domain-containing protein [Cribrihabitans pelagius]|uniref:choice-of-anchor L domain-containing protein n=1 Tax=Cribrihabitans pelagius TaxID=1765746 RepID=UPI003B5CDAAE
MSSASELPVDTSASAWQMANAMFGNGIVIMSADYTGASSASGIYSNGDSAAPDLTPSDSGVILSTGRAQDVTNSSGDVNTRAHTTTQHKTAGDSDLSEIAGGSTYDAAVFEADFVPAGSVLSMQFVFSSEEYLEYVDSGFNDAVGVWVNGVPAQLTVGEGDISIDNINDESNSNLYVDNSHQDDSYNTEMDGFTVTLKLTAPVNPGQINTIKIGIADAGDAKYDSNLLIAGDSIQTEVIAADDLVSVQEDDSATIDVLANDSHATGGTLHITHINNQPVVAGDTVTLADGETVTLNDDGTFTVTGKEDVATDEETTFTYTVADDAGTSDVGFVKMTTTPCFTEDTLIDTVHGPMPIAEIRPGTLVLTRDDGPQPVRWIGRSRRLAEGRDAPVQIAAGALGQHDAMELSPCHRVLVASGSAELMFGARQVLVAAKHLVNGTTVRLRQDARPVTYLHLLFDRHQIVRGNGLESESYHPGAQSLEGLDEDTRAEFMALMGDSWRSYGAAARMSLKAHESRLLAAELQ